MNTSYPRKSGKPFPLPATDGRTKWRIQHGSNTVRSLKCHELDPYLRAAKNLLLMGRYQKRKDICDLLREFEAYLKSLPTPPPQANIHRSGLKPKQRAEAFLWTLYRQGQQQITKNYARDAAAKILWRCIAVEVCPKQTADPFYAKVQIVRCLFACCERSSSRCTAGANATGFHGKGNTSLSSWSRSYGNNTDGFSMRVEGERSWKADG